MLFTLASTFMTATRMDGFAQAAAPAAAPAARAPRRAPRSATARAIDVVRRLAR